MTAELTLLKELMRLAEEVTQYTWEDGDADDDVITAINNLRDYTESLRQCLGE